MIVLETAPQPPVVPMGKAPESAVPATSGENIRKRIRLDGGREPGPGKAANSERRLKSEDLIRKEIRARKKCAIYLFSLVQLTDERLYLFDHKKKAKHFRIVRCRRWRMLNLTHICLTSQFKNDI